MNENLCYVQYRKILDYYYRLMISAMKRLVRKLLIGETIQLITLTGNVTVSYYIHVWNCLLISNSSNSNRNLKQKFFKIKLLLRHYFSNFCWSIYFSNSYTNSNFDFVKFKASNKIFDLNRDWKLTFFFPCQYFLTFKRNLICKVEKVTRKRELITLTQLRLKNKTHSTQCQH